MGLELRTEFVNGELRNMRKAMLPIVAAFGRVIVPALIYMAVNRINDTDPLTIDG